MIPYNYGIVWIKVKLLIKSNHIKNKSDKFNLLIIT